VRFCVYREVIKTPGAGRHILLGKYIHAHIQVHVHVPAVHWLVFLALCLSTKRNIGKATETAW